MADKPKPPQLLKGGVVLGQTDSLDAVVVESRELRNEKRYTVRELLASDEAMKDLLHERLLAVRDDLNFAINACNPNGALNNVSRSLQGVTNSLESIDRRLRAVEDGLKAVAHQEARLPSVSPAAWELWRKK